MIDYQQFFKLEEKEKWTISKHAPKELLSLVSKIHSDLSCIENQWILGAMYEGFYVVQDSIKAGYEWESILEWIDQGVYLNQSNSQGKDFLDHPFAEEYCRRAMDQDQYEHDIFVILLNAERLALADVFEKIWDFITE